MTITLPAAVDLDTGGSRVDTFVYDLLDSSLAKVGELHPVVTVNGSAAAPQVRTSVQGNANRTLTNLHLLAADAAHIDPRLHRIRPGWVDQDGALFPLGVHRVADASVTSRSGGARVELTCADESISHRSRIDRTLAYRAGRAGEGIIEELAGLLSVPVLGAEPTTAALGEALVFPVGSEDWSKVAAKVAAALGMLAPYFDNRGAWRWRHAPDWETAQPDHRYSTDPSAPMAQRRIINESLVRSTTLLDSPNTWIAVGSGGAAGAIVGRYTLPASAPNSIERIGVQILAPPVESTGLPSSAAAEAAARAAAAQALDDVGSASFDAPLDGRHDLYDLVEADRLRYREVGVAGRLSAGQKVSHQLRRIFLPTDPEGSYVGGAL